MRIRSYGGLTGAVLVATGLALTTIPAGASGSDPAGKAPAKQSKTAKASSTTVAKTFTATTNGGIKVEISNHGNVVGFASPNSNGQGRYEHINVGAVGEGYVMCYQGPSGIVNTFDVGQSETGWGAATTSGSSPFKVVRTTSDGKLTLTQSFKLNAVLRAVQIDMTVKNNTTSPITNVSLRRQVDFDVDTGGTDGWAGFNSFHGNSSITSVFAFTREFEAPADKTSHAMGLQHVGPANAPNHFANVTTNILETSCDGSPYEFGTASNVAFGDYGDTLRYVLGTLPAKGSKLVQVQYLRF